MGTLATWTLATAVLTVPSPAGQMKRVPAEPEKPCDAATSCNDLGVTYYYGRGVALDQAKAAQLFQKSCDAGNASSCNYLGAMYQKGESVALDKAKAEQLFQKSCDAGHASGCNSLGVMWCEGKDFAPDKAKAIQFLRRACDAGGDISCHNLRVCERTPANFAESVAQRLGYIRKARGRDRQVMTESLAALGPGSLDTLIAASEVVDSNLSDDSPMQVAASMGPSVIPPLQRMLVAEDKRSYKYRFAEKALALLGAPAIDPVLALARSGPAEQAETAARVLVRMDDPTGTTKRAILTLGPTAIKTIVEAASEDRTCEAAAIEALCAFGPTALPQLIAAAPYGGGESGFAYAAALCMGPDAVAAFVSVLNGATLDGKPATDQGPAGLEKRRIELNFAQHVLERVQPPPLEALHAVLASAPPDGQAAAATLLAGFHDPRSFDALIGGLRSPDSLVRFHCIEGLGAIGDRRARNPLLEIMLNARSTTSSEGAAAARALGEMYDPTLRTVLARCAKGSDKCAPGAAMSARNALLHSGDPAAIRLAKRYDTLTSLPAAGILLYIEAAALLLGATGLLVGVVAVVFAGARDPASVWLGFPPAAVLLAGVGAFWGAYPDSFIGYLEVIVLVTTGVAAAIVRSVWRTRNLGPREWIQSGLLLGAFYVGFGLGWLWLWGYLPL